MDNGFTDKLSVTAMNNGVWKLDNTLEFIHNGQSYCVFKGFMTDLGSIPRIFWILFAPWDLGRAAVLHDYLYKYSFATGMKRKECDELFRKAMEYLDPTLPAWKRKLVYLGVRAFGWHYF